MTARELAVIDAATVASILGQDLDGPAGELMRLYARALAELGGELLGRHDGSFVDFVSAARQSAATLTSALAELAMWRDVAGYDGLTVPFFKRAQIVSADLARAFTGEGPGRFSDLERLTLFADNLVPHVLRVEGVLVFDDVLVRRIERGELLEAGSPEEVEIRAVAVHAVELLSTAVREAGGTHEPWSIDEILWRRGAAPQYKAVPRHRCRTTAY